MLYIDKEWKGVSMNYPFLKKAKNILRCIKAFFVRASKYPARKN